MANSSPLVTVIIATYNSPITLQCAIQSVLHQDLTDFEVLVVGDCCPADYGNVIYDFNDERLQWINLPNRFGSQYGPNNEGLKRARGKYIAYLGHDDLWFPNHLSNLVNCIQPTDADLVHCLSALINPDGAYRVIGPPKLGRDYSNYHIPPSSWLYKRTITEDCGFWSRQEELSVGVDQDYLNRIALAGKKISFCKKQMVLKFLSGDWGLYNKKDNFPQVHFLEKMEKDPARLMQEILFELTTKFSITYSARKSIKQSFRSLLGNTFFYFFNFLPHHKWPLKQLLVYLYQRERRRNKKRRGL